MRNFEYVERAHGSGDPPVPALLEPAAEGMGDTATCKAVVNVPHMGSRATKLVEDFLLHAQGLHRSCKLHTMHPDFAWALSPLCMESRLCRSGQRSNTRTQAGQPVDQQTVTLERNTRQAIRIPINCQDKVAKAQELLQHAYSAPCSSLQPLCDAQYDLKLLTGNMMNNSTWQRLAGLAATLAGGNGLWRRSQEGSRDSTIADAAHPDPSVSLSAPARGLVDCATDVAPEPCKHSNVAHNEDLNAAVQAALAEAIAPVSRGTINSLARIVEATVGTFMACVAAVVYSHRINAKAALGESNRDGGQSAAALPVLQPLLRDPAGHADSNASLEGYSSRTMAAPEDDADEQQKLLLLVQAHMWQLLMGQTDKIFGKSYGGQWVNVVNDLQQVLQDGAQTMSQIMKENSAALQWKQLIVQTIREAQKELALAEGHARLKASEVCELQNTVYNVQQQLEKSDERRTAAEAAVIELVPLHLTVSQLRQRLAAEMTALHELQEKHAVTGALAEKHRAEATAFASDKADLTGKIMALRGDMHMKESELSLAKRRADLAESTQQLDRDEIKRLKCDMYKLQDELAADLEYTSKLELKRKMLEDEVESLGEKLACITVSESALRTQKSQAEENVEKLRESLESEMQGRVAAESLVAEYEAGIERRMRKLESEIQAKDSRIQLLEEDVKNGIKAQAAERARAAETEEASRIAYMQLAASLEVKVLERVKDQTMEIAALNDMVKQARETQSQCQEKHNTQMGSLRASSQEKVMKANQAAAAAEQACLQLQKSASTQIADANKQCHQSEAKSQAVERKLEHQGRAFKMRILTLEATIKDLKQTIADLCGQNHSQEQELTAKLEELDVSQAKERILLRELEHANEKLLHQESEIDRLGGEVAAVRNQMKIEVAARQDVAKQRSAAVEELRALLKAEQEKVFEAGEKIQQLEYASSDVSNVLVQNKQQAQELAHMREETKLLRAQYEALNLEKDGSHTAQAALKAKVRELSECVEMLSAVKVELEQKLPMLEEEGICQDDDSAEGEEGSRPSSRQGSRPPSHHSVGKRAHSAGSAGSQSPPLLPPIVRTRQSRSMTTGLRSPKAIGQYTPRASTYLPVKQIDDGIWIDKAYMPSGWTIEQGILMVPDALLVSSEQHQRVLQEQRQSMEYMEAHAALEAVKWACIQSERRLNGDPVATVHVTQPLTGTQKTLPRGDTQARVPKNHDQQASTTQSSCSLPRDASQLELRQPHRKDHGNSAVVAEQEQISIVGSAPVARPS